MTNITPLSNRPQLMGTPLGLAQPQQVHMLQPQPQSFMSRALGVVRSAANRVMDNRPLPEAVDGSATLAMNASVPAGYVPVGLTTPTAQTGASSATLGMTPTQAAMLSGISSYADQQTSVPQLNQTNQTGVGTSGSTDGGQNVTNRNIVSDDTNLQGAYSPWGSPTNGLVPFGYGGYGASMTGAYGLGYTPFDSARGGLLGLLGGFF